MHNKMINLLNRPSKQLLFLKKTQLVSLGSKTKPIHCNFCPFTALPFSAFKC